jgi:cellulose synthase/poly-beta-1,6-N-acetylglucosamine synthase-like glycosyltransferase
MLLLLSHADWILLAFSVFVLDIPRYTISLLSLVALRWPRRPAILEAVGGVTISVILPAFNGGPGLLQSIASLHRQTFKPLEIIVVDDGSIDDTLATAREAQAAGLIDMVIHHGTRCGRSPAVNAGARFARGDLILAMDPDTIFAPNALARLAAAFRDPRVAAACCNLGVSNEDASFTTALQGLEYLMSISAGKSFLNIFGAISCCSGACSVYRRDIFLERGGLDPGPGEDLEMTLRLRRLGYRVRFVSEAWADTAVPDNPVSLIRQRQRWDRDSLRIRLIEYREIEIFKPERLSDTLQRLDFIVFDLVPTLSFPFYMIYCTLIFGPQTLLFLVAVYALLLGIALFNIALASLMFGRSPTLFGLSVALVFPFYQGIAMKLTRFVAYSSEILFSTSRSDDYVPPRVRRALTGQRT